ncbi:hypothetical protein K469DRAFT_688162 [Zopfia rhizophila CBS 207.26]|uniref:Uncharacterized protein n=1 Tax=Zopfia rhizophila CBS 207.26 TaxID=1314779 RepID=A0A6A6E3Q9_9PEZI|nr:hypothetical protein K469DRAFT_688162 [Zopfia rhizophila CBS 207.26]
MTITLVIDPKNPNLASNTRAFAYTGDNPQDHAKPPKGRRLYKFPDPFARQLKLWMKERAPNSPPKMARQNSTDEGCNFTIHTPYSRPEKIIMLPETCKAMQNLAEAFQDEYGVQYPNRCLTSVQQNAILQALENTALPDENLDEFTSPETLHRAFYVPNSQIGFLSRANEGRYTSHDVDVRGSASTVDTTPVSTPNNSPESTPEVQTEVVLVGKPYSYDHK